MIQFGIDVECARRFQSLHGKRVGLIVNPTSVDRHFRHLIDLLIDVKEVDVAMLYGPEHGIRGEAQYMVSVDNEARDRRTGLPVQSLYGSSFDSLTPAASSLEKLDALVFDIQDIGSRYYTYIYTMALAMKAAAKAKIAFYVFDRPNPIGLGLVEGNLVGDRFRSFVGLYALPNRHGLTAGEVARWLNVEEQMGVELTVISCDGLTRRDDWHTTKRSFIPPSPNMPTCDTALVYPGMCLGEGTNVSEGRGTCRPFEQFGAPYLKSDEVVRRLEREQLPGVVFRACSFTPTFDKWKGQSCEGAFIHVVDPQRFRPFLTGAKAIAVCRELGGDAFAWRADAYEFVADIPAFDLLCGTDEVRLAIDDGRSIDPFFQQHESTALQFRAKSQRYWLYE